MARYGTKKLAARYHDDVEYQVSTPSGAVRGGDTVVGTYQTLDEAEHVAIDRALSYGNAKIDVLVYSREGAMWLGGEEAAESYNEDPDASVFERILVRAQLVGRVP